MPDDDVNTESQFIQTAFDKAAQSLTDQRGKKITVVFQTIPPQAELAFRDILFRMGSTPLRDQGLRDSKPKKKFNEFTKKILLHFTENTHVNCRISNIQSA